MAVEVLTLVTVRCDVAECPNEIACGANKDFAGENGWWLDDSIMDQRLDLCPSCYRTIRELVFGEQTSEKTEIENQTVEGRGSSDSSETEAV